MVVFGSMCVRNSPVMLTDQPASECDQDECDSIIAEGHGDA